MSKKVCTQCSCTDVSQDWYAHDQGICFVCNTCGFVGDPEEFKAQTVFHSITQSEETLAEKLMYWEQNPPESGWTSNIIRDAYRKYEEAFAATAAKLKEVYDE